MFGEAVAVPFLQATCHVGSTAIPPSGGGSAGSNPAMGTIS